MNVKTPRECLCGGGCRPTKDSLTHGTDVPGFQSASRLENLLGLAFQTTKNKFKCLCLSVLIVVFLFIAITLFYLDKGSYYYVCLSIIPIVFFNLFYTYKYASSEQKFIRAFSSAKDV